MTELDPQAQALLDEVDASTSPPMTTLSIETIRRLGEEFLTAADSEPVDEIVDFKLAGDDADIPVRIYRPDVSETPPILCFFHGGGWVRGSITASDGLCRILANKTECLVVSVGYRRAPEATFPAALADCYYVVKWCQEHAAELSGDPESIATVGSSAGGNLAAAVSLLARDQRSVDVTHQTLLYPMLNPPSLNWFDSYDKNGEGYFLTLEKTKWFIDQYLPEQYHRRNAYAFPLLANDLSGLPPTTVVTGGFDPLRDEGKEFADRLDEASVPVEQLHYEGQIHGFVSLYEHIDAGREALEGLSSELRTFL